MQVFDYGDAVGKGENIRSSRIRNALAEKQLDPNSVRNQFEREQLSGVKQRNAMAQTEFDDAQKQQNTKELFQALTEISQNPAAADFHVPRLKEKGILRSDFDYRNMSPEEISSTAAQGAQAISKSLNMGAQGKGPSAVQEYNFYQDLTPENKAIFLKIKRATPNAKFIDAGDTVQALDPVTAQPIAEIQKGLPPAQQPENLQRTEQVKADVAQKSKEKSLQVQNEKAYKTYVIGMTRLTKAMSKTQTGPVEGRLPALTEGQQIAEGSLASMAPILKQLFRAAGEGIFTDKDQALLMDMLPTRKDHPAAIKEKIENINAIVASKLGKDSPQQDTGGWTIEEL